MRKLLLEILAIATAPTKRYMTPEYDYKVRLEAIRRIARKNLTS